MLLDNASIEQLNAKIKGDVVAPSSMEYDEARKIWNGMFDKKPALISRCQTAEDVVESIRFAKMHDLEIAVRSGGHNSAGTGSVDGGIVIDLSPMNSVVVDPSDNTVSVGGGCLLSDVDAATQKYGLAIPAGIISHTGVGGLTLGGGFGWLSRKYGFSIDNLLGADVVTAEGTIVHASADENPDLFWGLRGGGGNFGVVTNFKFKGAKIGNEVYSGVMIKSFDDAREFLKFHREYVRSLPDEMTIWLVFRHAPPLPFLAEEYHWKLVIVVAFSYVGDQEKGKALMQPLRDLGKTLGEGSGMNPYSAWQTTFDALVSHGARNYWKSHNLKGIPDDAIELIIEYAQKMPTKECEIFIPHMEGAPSRVAPDATAYSFRTQPFVMNVHTRWQEAKDDERCMKWARELYEATTPFSQGVYVNFISDKEAERAREAYTDEVWKRLKTVKKRWDPTNLFHINMNITPNGTK